MSRENAKSKKTLPMGVAIKTLLRLGIRPEKKTEHQLKVDEWNYYPTSGTIYRDGDPRKMPERGLKEFIKLVRKQNPDNTVAPSAPNDPSPFEGIGIDLSGEQPVSMCKDISQS